AGGDPLGAAGASRAPRSCRRAQGRVRRSRLDGHHSEPPAAEPIAQPVPRPVTPPVAEPVPFGGADPLARRRLVPEPVPERPRVTASVALTVPFSHAQAA